jgi:hypothetical protein
MTREERAVYMRAYRQRNAETRKRPADLDRSKPKGENVKLDRVGYMRQYMRWRRARKPCSASA